MVKDDGGDDANIDKGNIFGFCVAGIDQPYFYSHRPYFDPRNVDFNHFGILYEFAGACYLIYNHTDPLTSISTVKHGWVLKHQIGPYLKHEWTSLPKKKVGRFGQGVPLSRGSWNVYSVLIQQLRGRCLEKAIEEDRTTQNSTGGISINQLGDKLDKEFAQVVGAVVGSRMAQKLKAAKDSNSFMEEFMVFDN